MHSKLERETFFLKELKRKKKAPCEVASMIKGHKISIGFPLIVAGKMSQ